MPRSNEDLSRALEGIIVGRGFELVSFRTFVVNGKQTLRCIVDRPEGGITVDECAKINKKVFFNLSENGYLGDNFAVEINSPGLDRPLKSMQDFLKVKGRQVCLWLKNPVEGKTFIEVEVAGVSEDCLIAVYKEKVLHINFEIVNTGKEKIII